MAKKNYKLGKGRYHVFEGKRYQLYKTCGSHNEALNIADEMRNKGLLARAEGNKVYIKRK